MSHGLDVDTDSGVGCILHVQDPESEGTLASSVAHPVLALPGRLVITGWGLSPLATGLRCAFPPLHLEASGVCVLLSFPETCLSSSSLPGS